MKYIGLFLTLGLTFTLLTIASPVQAQTDWYVDANSGNNSNDCQTPETACKTIEATIAKSNGGDTIYIAAGIYNETIVMSRNLTLVGNSAASTIVDGGGTDRGFSIYPNLSLTIHNLTIRNGSVAGAGSAGSGGGISGSNVTLTIHNSILTGNTAANRGGAIHVEDGSTINIYDTTFSGNTAGNDGGAINIYDSTVNIYRSTFDNNTGTGASGIPEGGAIFANSGAILAIENSTFSANSAEFGGAIQHSGGTTTMTSSTFYGNTATSAIGGGFDVYGGTLTLENTLLAGSVTGGNCSLSNGSIVSSGYNLSDDTSCGTWFTQTGDQNSATADLGALENHGGRTHTHAPGTSSAAIDAGNCSGSDQRGRNHVTDLSGYANIGNGCDIGAFEVQESATTVFVSVIGSDTNDCLSSGNPCRTIMNAIDQVISGGAVYLTPGVFDTELLEINKSVSIWGVQNDPYFTVIDGNEAGPVITIESGYNVILDRLIIRNGITSSEGGGIFNKGSDLTLQKSTVTGNSAFRGGGIYNDGGDLSIHDSTVSDNTTDDDGGGVNMRGGGTLEIRRSTFSNNSTGTGGYLEGGALMKTGGSALIVDSTFSGNSANYGGAIQHDGGSTTVTNSTFDGNGAVSGIGGAFDVYGGGTFTLSNALLSDSGPGNNCSLSVGSIVSDGYNLSDDGSCSTWFSNTGDKNNAVAGLGPLQDNGGWTETHEVLNFSAALDAGNCSAGTDQIEETRPVDLVNYDNVANGCDIGAFEQQSQLVPPFITMVESDGSTSVAEGGATDTYDIVLSEAIIAGTLTVSATPDSQCDVGNGAGVAMTHDFTSATSTTWTVTVSAVNDTVGEALHSCVVVNALESSSADQYPSSVSIDNVTATITDNDPCTDCNAPIILAASSTCSEVTLRYIAQGGTLAHLDYGFTVLRWTTGETVASELVPALQVGETYTVSLALGRVYPTGTVLTVNIPTNSGPLLVDVVCQ